MHGNEVAYLPVLGFGPEFQDLFVDVRLAVPLREGSIGGALLCDGSCGEEATPCDGPWVEEVEPCDDHALFSGGLPVGGYPLLGAIELAFDPTMLLATEALRRCGGRPFR